MTLSHQLQQYEQRTPCLGKIDALQASDGKPAVQWRVEAIPRKWQSHEHAVESRYDWRVPSHSMCSATGSQI